MRLFGPAAVAVLTLSTAFAAEAAAQADDPAPMSILVHITHGPEHPTRAALGFAVAAAALDEGHDVTVFLAGDAVQLARQGVVDALSGLGTGELDALVARVVAGGARFFLSGGSSAARGLDSADVALPTFETAGPATLVRLSLEHDRQFVY